MSDTEEVRGNTAGASGEKKEVVITDCPVQSVVVYRDRAEVGLITKFELFVSVLVQCLWPIRTCSPNFP